MRVYFAKLYLFCTISRHQCVIDLKANKLRIGTTGTETKFLSENELPNHGRLHNPHQEVADSKEKEEERIAKALEVISFTMA